MNVIDKSFAAEADRIAKAERTRKQRQLRLAVIAALAVTVAAIAYYVWATTLCGNCGAPLPLPPA
jgi:type VI protein secretion system component VasF